VARFVWDRVFEAIWTCREMSATVRATPHRACGLLQRNKPLMEERLLTAMSCQIGKSDPTHRLLDE